MASNRRLQTAEESARLGERVLDYVGQAVIATDDIIMVTDRTGSILWVNRAFTRATGYTVREALGRNPRGLLRSGVHEAAFYQELWETILGGRVWSGEMINRRKDGTHYPEEVTITPVGAGPEGPEHFVAIKRDLTEVRRLESQFLQAQKMETVGRLVGGITHDFNNLLTMINTSVQLALQDLPVEHPARAELGQIGQAGHRAAALTRQVLAFSRQQILRPVLLDLNRLVKAWEETLPRMLGDTVAVVLDLVPDAGCVRADPGQLDQVVMNLAVNARDAMPRGGRLTIATRNADRGVSPAVLDASLPPGPHVKLSVTDTGVGMDEVTRNRVFEPFFTTKGVGEGTGLGLATVHGIVQQHGGSVRISSEPGRGTSVEIYLPRVDGRP